MYKDKWAHTQPMGGLKSTLSLMRTLGPSPASLVQSSQSLLSNSLGEYDCISDDFVLSTWRRDDNINDNLVWVGACIQNCGKDKFGDMKRRKRKGEGEVKCFAQRED